MAHVQGAFRQAARAPQRRDGRRSRRRAQKTASTSGSALISVAPSLRWRGRESYLERVAREHAWQPATARASGCGPETRRSASTKQLASPRPPSLRASRLPLVAGAWVITKSPSAAATARRTADSLCACPQQGVERVLLCVLPRAAAAAARTDQKESLSSAASGLRPQRARHFARARALARGRHQVRGCSCRSHRARASSA